MTAIERQLTIEVPPHDDNAERVFIGGLLRDSKYLDELESPVPVEALYDHRLRLIYATMLDLQQDSAPIDGVTVANRLREAGRLSGAGGEAEIAGLIYGTLTGAQSKYYAEIILQHWRRRHIIAHAGEAIRDAHRMADPMDIQANLEASFQAIESSRAEEILFDCFHVSGDVVSEVRKRKSEGRTEVGVPTGFVDLDNLTSGLVPSELVVIGARPGMGKTALASNICVNACQSTTVLFVSIEMAREQIVQRILSSLAGVNSVRVRRATVNDEEIDRMKQATARLRGGRFWIADIPRANIAEVVHVARQVKRKQPELSVVVVDYVQLIRHEDRKMPREQQVAEISGRLKALARSLKVCVVALSQLNRMVEGRKTKRPELSDLRESGAVEQDADVIALIHRPEAYSPNDRPGEADLIVAKVRNGPTGDVSLKYDKSTTTFSNPDREWYEQPHAP